MKRLALVLAAATALSCGGGDTARYFRIVFPTLTTFARPDSCFQPDSLLPATKPEEIAAENYCAVGKKPRLSGTTNENLVSEESWTLFETTDSTTYLYRVSGTTRSGFQGKRAGDKYTFTGKSNSFRKTCDSGLSDCAGKCTNRNADANNCGSCGNVCPSTTPVCRNGICRAACNTSPQTCGGTSTDVMTDAANCGFCGNACTSGQFCSEGSCVSACGFRCTDSRFNVAGCATPLREFTTDTVMTTEFTVAGGNVAGTQSQSTTYKCTGAGTGACPSDMDQRCPSCTLQVPITGRESFKVTEFEQR